MNIKFDKVFYSKSEADTERFGFKLGREIAKYPGTILALHGDLGAGKTVFTRGFAAGLGVDEPISSPTYTILQEYKLPDGNYLYHFDLYRIDNEIAALGFGIDEYFIDPKGICVIEWPERAGGILPDHTLHLNIQYSDGENRELTLRRSN